MWLNGVLFCWLDIFERVGCFLIGCMLDCFLGCVVLVLSLMGLFFIVDCLVVVFVCFILLGVDFDRVLEDKR